MAGHEDPFGRSAAPTDGLFCPFCHMLLVLPNVDNIVCGTCGFACKYGGAWAAGGGRRVRAAPHSWGAG